MLSKLFGRKPAPPLSARAPSPKEAFELFSLSEGGFVIPDWDRLERGLADRLQHEDPDALWTAVAHSWLFSLQQALGDDFHIAQSNKFLLLSCASDREDELFLEYAERTRKRIQLLLEGIAEDTGFGKTCVMVFATQEQYYEYVANYYPAEGEFAFSGGMFIHGGYGHFVCVHDHISLIEPVIAHELTHMHLSHLPIPLWLNEGLAVNTERILSPGHGSLYTAEEMRQKHEAFWTDETIQEFWSGKSFQRSDDGNLLSYDLAKMLTSLLSDNRSAFVAFANAADRADAGREAALKHLKVELGEVAAYLVQAGNWTPEPERWKNSKESA